MWLPWSGAVEWPHLQHRFSTPPATRATRSHMCPPSTSPRQLRCPSAPPSRHSGDCALPCSTWCPPRPPPTCSVICGEGGVLARGLCEKAGVWRGWCRQGCATATGGSSIRSERQHRGVGVPSRDGWCRPCGCAQRDGAVLWQAHTRHRGVAGQAGRHLARSATLRPSVSRASCAAWAEPGVCIRHMRMGVPAPSPDSGHDATAQLCLQLPRGLQQRAHSAMPALLLQLQ